MNKPENWNEMTGNEKRAWQVQHDPNFWDKDGDIEKGSEEEKKIDAEIEKLEQMK